MAPTGGKKELSVMSAVRITPELREQYDEFAKALNLSLSDALRIGLEWFMREGRDDYILSQQELLKMYQRKQKK